MARQYMSKEDFSNNTNQNEIVDGINDSISRFHLENTPEWAT